MVSMDLMVGLATGLILGIGLSSLLYFLIKITGKVKVEVEDKPARTTNGPQYTNHVYHRDDRVQYSPQRKRRVQPQPEPFPQYEEEEDDGYETEEDDYYPREDQPYRQDPHPVRDSRGKKFLNDLQRDMQEQEEEDDEGRNADQPRPVPATRRSRTKRVTKKNVRQPRPVQGEYADEEDGDVPEAFFDEKPLYKKKTTRKKIN